MSFSPSVSFSSPVSDRRSRVQQHTFDRDERIFSRDHSRDENQNSPIRPDRIRDTIAECITTNGVKNIEIRSKYLLDAIDKVNENSPLRPQKDFFIEKEPYPTLFHHIDDIKAEITKISSQVALEHLMTLQKEIAYIEPIWNEARQESGNMVSYGNIWKLFRPGDLVLRKDRIGNLWLFVFNRVTYYDTGKNKYGLKENRIAFEVSCLTWNEVDGCFKKYYVGFTGSEFVGQRHVNSLPVYPIRYEEGMTRESIEAALVKRGRKWYELITAAPICQFHCGLALKSKTYNDIGEKTREKLQADGRIVIDEQSKNSTEIDSVLGTDSFKNESRGIPRQSSDGAYEWGKIPISATLTDEQAMFCPAVIRCHDLRSKAMYTVSVDNLRPVEWNKHAMDQLVLEKDKKNMLKGLVRHHSSRNRRNERGDVIAGKGQSFVILLHGPSGVGKTLTAESIAEIEQKPLVAMSIGEMVWDETRLQERLKSEFQRAIDWDAILLLDEADVVLEARSFEDVRRNGIVSIFLRELEYYQGILFLTTNRVSAMDVAFQSRIQIGISFDSMTSDIRSQVWTQLLTLNGRNRILGSEALKSIHTELNKHKLNGRQIRNVLNVAEGLAFQEYGEGGKLEYKHIEKATKAAVEFQEMLEEAKSKMRLEQTAWAPW